MTQHRMRWTNTASRGCAYVRRTAFNRVVADCMATPDKKSKVQTGRVMLHLREQIGCVTCSLLTDC